MKLQKLGDFLKHNNNHVCVCVYYLELERKQNGNHFHATFMDPIY